MLSKATNAWRRLLRDESGQNMIEYALVAALIALGAIVAMQGVATSLSTAFSKSVEPPGRVCKLGFRSRIRRGRAMPQARPLRKQLSGYT